MSEAERIAAMAARIRELEAANRQMEHDNNGLQHIVGIKNDIIAILKGIKELSHG